MNVLDVLENEASPPLFLPKSAELHKNKEIDLFALTKERDSERFKYCNGQTQQERVRKLLKQKLLTTNSLPCQKCGCWTVAFQIPPDYPIHFLAIG
jgi:hypothetical protein